MNVATSAPVHPAFVAVVVAIPVLLLLPGLIPDSGSRRHQRRFAQMGATLALVSFAAAILVAVGSLGRAPIVGSLVQFGPVGLSVFVDVLSVVMLLLVSFLGAVVMRYAVNYLDGDPRQGRFTKWLAVTIGSVLTLIISGNLLMFAFAWMATSLSLHKLLTFYAERPGAILAARKKFLISRLGDAAMIGILVLSYRCFGTWDFQHLFAAVAGKSLQGPVEWGCLGGISAMLVACAILKSAQFPFHSWLPDTMETPTPVSALMHAGIINAGGYLIVRFSPLVSLFPTALNVLALIGVFTALFASVIMLTQTSVKRSLAYSTIAQMGFMMLQCGLGAFSLAVLHLVAHSLYKAHAFLSSGSLIALSKSAWVPSGRPAAHPIIFLGTLVAAIVLTVCQGALFGIHPASEPGVLVLGSIFMMALAYMLWNLWSSSLRAQLLPKGLLVSTGAGVAYFALHAAFSHLLAPVVSHYAPTRGTFELIVLFLIVVLFMAMLTFQALLPQLSTTPVGRSLYVHAHKGFYFVTLANRIVSALSLKTTTH